MEMEVGDFFLAEHPVTMGEYLEYVNDLARREGPDVAMARSPRVISDDPRTTYLREDGAGRWNLPEVDAEGDRWDARWPVMGISWHDAVAYCGWRSERDGRRYRLPTGEEWEKAARGVDGRWYPWGWGVDPSLCNLRESRKERPSPVAVEEFPEDRSVYGVRGLGGNIRDWTSSEMVEGTGEAPRVVRDSRGGSWRGTARDPRAASRLGREPALVGDGVGMRLARSRT
jgi:serine/threonine-protein kinase